MNENRDFQLQMKNDRSNGPKASGQKLYEPPVLVCYGSVSLLTQGASVKNGEAGRTAL